MHKLFYILVFLVFARQSMAQSNQFDFQIQSVDSTNYEMQLQLLEPENVQFIRIEIMEEGQDFKTMEASLNKKNDNKYYLFFKEEENEVLIENMAFSFTHHDGDEVIIEYLKEPSFRVTLLDQNVNELSSLQKTID